MAVVHERATLGIEHADAGPFHRDPDPIVSIHHQGLDIVAGQSGVIGRIVAPHPHADTVITCETICSGDPQITVVVARQRLDFS